MFGYAQLILVVPDVWGLIVEPTPHTLGSVPPAMPRGIPVSYYNSMNNHTTKMRMPNTHIFLSRSAIKYAVNIYQRLPNNTSRQSGAVRSLSTTIGAFGGYQTLPTRTRFVHVTTAPIWLVWWRLPSLTNCYHGADLALPRPQKAFTNSASAAGNRSYIGV